MKNTRIAGITSLFLLVVFLFSGCKPTQTPSGYSGANAPKYENAAYTVINDNKPQFSDDEITEESFERYSALDNLGRCGVAIACIGVDIMPTEDRGNIGMVKPSGWHTVKYDIVDGKYLYNRCHLIGFQLAGENANDRNLITGTRYFNVEGMLPFENMVADYVKETENHVMYRVTPYYEGDDLVARGVFMEAYSVEDNGDGVCFNVFVHNIQPGITIDYATGDSTLSKEENTSSSRSADFVLNTNSKKFHIPTCDSVSDMNPANKKEYCGSREDLIDDGYDPCKNCDP